MSLRLVNEHVNIPGYKILERLGSGSYSTVYKASKLDNPQQYVAIKCIEKANLSPSGRNNIVNEIKIMKLLQHKYVIKLIDFQWDEKFIYLILEYCEVGDLSTFIKRRRRLPESIFLKFIQQLALALQFLRSHNVSHFDLKPQNLLLTKCPKLTLKIGDFGFAQFLSEDTLKTSIRGSPLYMAPEMLLKQQSSPKADLWSVGIISYQCLFGQPPILNSSICDIVKSHKNEVPIEIPKNIVSSECSDMLSRLLVYDPHVRIDFDEFFNHPFLDLEHYPTEETYSKAVTLIHEAVKLDYKKEYKQSFKIYCQALRYLVPYVKDLDDYTKKDALQKKVFEYTKRAEELQNYLTKDINVENDEPSGSKQSVDHDSSKTPSLASLCGSTPALMTAIELAKVGYMYLFEKNYSEALEKLKSALSIVIPVLKTEPPGQRKDLLVKQVQEWLTYAENIKVLLSAKKTDKIDDQLLDCPDACVIQ